MESCIYCGQRAGLLKKKHDECDIKHRSGFHKIADLINDVIIFGAGYDEIDILVDQIAKETFNKDRKREAILSGWDSSVGKFLEDGVLSIDDEEKVAIFLNNFSFSPKELNQNKSYLKLIQSRILRDIMNGGALAVKTFQKVPFNLQKTEKIIYVFNDVDYYIEDKKRERNRGYGGSAIRLAKGVYYRTGAFEGIRVQKSDMTYVDHGNMGVTNKHIYFQGLNKNFRIWFKNIETLSPYADGLGLLTDGAEVKRKVFVIGDGWFVYNLTTNISNLYIQ